VTTSTIRLSSGSVTGPIGGEALAGERAGCLGGGDGGGLACTGGGGGGT